ncbi:TVP38/TMEM64 family protein [Kiloniella laminariae]|uniref:TVP38/TMEM64 family membrane protein n=1 Tax=Kiloniella laminariae TaxID=454162 RepID=A0ABT4LKH2_9PROT|nr:TVP38/TMEM64 family protein [Kiloniella laminariae]MCZ4281605.1 TVP38/TMEM64 family protein [Kiloniella laminariae]
MSAKNNTPLAKGSRLKRLLPLLILLLGLAAVYAMGWHRYLSFGILQENRENLIGFVQGQKVIAALAFLALYALAVAFSIPGGSFLTIAGGFMFGTWLGGLYAVMAATVGSTLVFLAAKTAFGGILRQKASGYLQKMESGFKENELSYLLVLRLVPLFPFWLVNLVPAFVGMSLRNYVIGTFFGIIPGTFVYASVGNGLDALFRSGETPDLGIILRPEILLPIMGLALLSLVPVLYKKYCKEKQA